MKEGASAQSLQGVSRLGWRLRRACSLAARHRCIARFAGGYLAAAGIALELLRARGLGAVLGWATTAAAHGQYLDAKRYGFWLTSRRRNGNASDVLVVASTLGIDSAQTGIFLGLLASALRRLRAQRGDGEIGCALVTDPAGEAALRKFPGAAALGISVAKFETPTLQALLETARAHAGQSAQVALMKPGYLPGEVAVPCDKPAALVYGDEDRIDAAGRCSAPFFKPNFSPDLLLADDFLGCLVLPSKIAAALPEEAEDYHSLVLRLVEQASAVVHVDAVLAHRFAPVHCAGKDAVPPGYLGAFLRNRYGPQAKAVRSSSPGPRWRCDFGHRDASVSVILPTRDRLPLLRNCIEGIFESNHGEFEVVVLDNESAEPETLDWLAQAVRRWPALKVVAAPGQFNWSRLNNLGMAHARGDVFVFLNNDTVPRSKDWLARFADVALRPDVGAVGALLLYASGRIQHAGVVVGDGRWADHIYRGDFPNGDGHVFVPPNLPRNVSAVTGACMALSRRTVERIGAFDEDYIVAGSDVEICLRALDHGLLNVYLPDVVLLHLESQTRGRRDPASDVSRLVALLQARGPEDPYFSRHLRGAPLYLTRRAPRERLA